LGRKVHPIGFRLGYNKEWFSVWYAEGKQYTEFLHQDLKIRQLIDKELADAEVSRIKIERFPKQINITIHTARPGLVIGRKGAEINRLRQELEELTGQRVSLKVEEVKKPELDAVLVARSIARQIEKRVSYRRAMKQAVARAMKAGAKGIMIQCKGRLAGAEMARKEVIKEGRIPRNTLRADIDYALAEALTILGKIGVKVWIYKGDLLPKKPEFEAFLVTEEATASE
jgi:small subunit ribosomal protein S3